MFVNLINIKYFNASETKNHFMIKSNFNSIEPTEKNTKIDNFISKTETKHNNNQNDSLILPQQLNKTDIIYPNYEDNQEIDSKIKSKDVLINKLSQEIFNLRETIKNDNVEIISQKYKKLCDEYKRLKLDHDNVYARNIILQDSLEMAKKDRDNIDENLKKQKITEAKMYDKIDILEKNIKEKEIKIIALQNDINRFQNMIQKQEDIITKMKSQDINKEIFNSMQKQDQKINQLILYMKEIYSNVSFLPCNDNKLIETIVYGQDRYFAYYNEIYRFIAKQHECSNLENQVIAKTLSKKMDDILFVLSNQNIVQDVSFGNNSMISHTQSVSNLPNFAENKKSMQNIQENQYQNKSPIQNKNQTIIKQYKDIHKKK